jgi:hypothetical protein
VVNIFSQSEYFYPDVTKSIEIRPAMSYHTRAHCARRPCYEAFSLYQSVDLAGRVRSSAIRRPGRPGAFASSAGPLAPPISPPTDQARPAHPNRASMRPNAIHAFAEAPDNGSLISIQSPSEHFQEGAYTWHSVDLSETHALNAIDGQLHLTAPSGEQLAYTYDRMVEHDNGDWTWIGHGANEGDEALVTFGADAAFGSFAQAGQLPLRLTVRDGKSWLVETDSGQLSKLNSAATRPQSPDFLIPPASSFAPSADTYSATPATSSQTAYATTPSSGPVVDLVLGYTQGFANGLGGTSQAVTRLNNLVDVANQSYFNSQLPGQVRLVRTVLVSYPDNTSNDNALRDLTGSGSGAASLATIRQARDAYGADLVSIVRKFNTPENAGCGIAWLLGAEKRGVSTTDAPYGYSVVSDGTDTDTNGGTYYCRDESLAHEMGHNMGSAHDRTTATVSGVLHYGAYAYSFGYKTTSTTGNFFTIMAYGDNGQNIYRIFSNPRSTYCGGRACGVTDQVDNARSLSQTMPTVASFRATIVPMPHIAKRSDFNGDGISDLLFRNQSNGGNGIWRSASSATQQAVTALNLDWYIAATGDFNGDGVSDIFWRNRVTNGTWLWRSANSATAAGAGIVGQEWVVGGIGDFNHDGKSDILWRNTSTGANIIWKSGDRNTTQAVTAVTDQRWKVGAVGDFNGDGAADIVWRNTTTGASVGTGANVIWRSGSSSTTQAMPIVGLPWQLVGAADFNGDHVDDLIWRNSSTGANNMFLSASSATQKFVSTVADQHWQIRGLGDYNGDGVSDLVWRNASTGAQALWRSANSATPQPITGAATSFVIAP